MTDEEVVRTLQSMKPCVVNAEAQNEAIDRACEIIRSKIAADQAIEQAIKENGCWVDTLAE